MEKMTLSRALRYKKRVVETIRATESDIQSYNCVVEGTEPEVDVRKALAKRKAWVDHLVLLKLQIQEATRPIQKMVLELAETKSEIAFLQRINTTHGRVENRWGGATPELWFAVIRKTEKDQLVADLQKRIDELQTKIDAFNAEHTIEVIAPEV